VQPLFAIWSIESMSIKKSGEVKKEEVYFYIFPDHVNLIGEIS
jgi:hypothetical protein